MTKGCVSPELLHKMIKLDVVGKSVYYGTYRQMLTLYDQFSAMKCLCKLYYWSVALQRWVDIK